MLLPTLDDFVLPPPEIFETMVAVLIFKRRKTNRWGVENVGNIFFLRDFFRSENSLKAHPLAERFTQVHVIMNLCPCYCTCL